MSFFDNARVELAMRSMLKPDVERLLDQMESEYYQPTTTAARKQQIFTQTQDAVAVAQFSVSNTSQMINSIMVMEARRSPPPSTQQGDSNKDITNQSEAGMGVAVDFVPKRALSSSCFLAFSEQSTQDQNLMYVPVRHSTAPLAVARGTPISIATPDGTPVSLETLSADAVFIARVGGKPPVEEFPCAPEMLDARNSLELMQYPKTHTNRFAALSDDGSSSVELNSESGSEIKLPLKTSASTLPRDLACLQSEDKLQHTASSYVEGIPFVGSHWDCPIQSVRKRRTPSSAATSSTTSSMTSSPVRSIPPLLSGIQEDVETLEQELNTHNLSEYVGTPGLRRTNSGGTENGVASSVATSAFTLQSTFHSRQRAQERDIKRIEIKSALKNGIPRRSVTGNWVVDDGTTCVVVASEDMVGGVSVAHASSTQKSRVVSAWKKPLFPIRGKGPLWTDC